MDISDRLVFAMVVFLTPIVIEFAVSALRRSVRYRWNDTLANVTLSLLTVVGSALIAGLTLWLYNQVYRAAGRQLPASAAMTWIVALVAYDFLYYWAHRAHHTVALLWGVHVVHHSGEDMNFALAVRQSALGELTTWYFFLPMALVGIPPEVYIGVAGIQLLYQYSIHNTYVPALGWLEYILVTPSQHRVHHGRNHVYLDKNYGNIFVIWDRLFGSYQPELRDHPVVYGLRHGARTWNPVTLQTQGFVEIVRKAAGCQCALDRVRCFLEPPGWCPPSLAPGRFAGDHDDGPSAMFRKYDPRLPRTTAVYCVAQFVVLVAAVAVIVTKLGVLTAGSTTLAVALIVAHAWVLGGLLDGAPRFWRIELARLAAVVVAVPAVVASAGKPLGPPLVLCAAFAAVCALYLLRFRAGFVAGATARAGRTVMVG